MLDRQLIDRLAWTLIRAPILSLGQLLLLAYLAAFGNRFLFRKSGDARYLAGVLLIVFAGVLWNSLATARAAELEPLDSQKPGVYTLRGRFILAGKIPEQFRLEAKDRKYWNGSEWVTVGPGEADKILGENTVYDESLVVAKDGGVANVLVWVRDADIPLPKPRNEEPPPALEPARLRFKDGRLDPHVLVMQSQQELTVRNELPFAINFHARTTVNASYNILLPPARKQKLAFPKAERRPATLSSSIHPWFRGYLLVRDNPYFAVSGTDGRFEITNLPPGEWEFQFWHEKAGYLNTEVWPKGRLRVKIDSGATDLGDIKLALKDFGLKPPEPDGLSDWFRDAPYPEIGFPQSYEIDRAYVSIAAHPPAHRELDVSNEVSAVLGWLGQWTIQDFYEIKPPDHDRRQAVWAKARKRLDDLLTEQQLARLRQLVIQQRRAEVFINPVHLPELKLSDEQLAEIHSRWQEHLSRGKQSPTQPPSERSDEAAKANTGRESYKRFWHQAYEILTESQRNTFREQRGPPVASTTSTTAPYQP